MAYEPYDWTEADMVGGNTALDFVNTVSNWETGPVDRLDGAAGFARWTGVAGLLDAKDQARLAQEIADDADALAEFYEDASQLRAALWRVFTAASNNESPSAADLALLNEGKVRSAKHCQIVHEESGFKRRCTEEAPASERALRMIVEAAEDLLLHGRLDRLHTCGGPECGWIFLDLSKNGRRRWCSMATCGNEAKVKKFRARKKVEAA